MIIGGALQLKLSKSYSFICYFNLLWISIYNEWLSLEEICQHRIWLTKSCRHAVCKYINNWVVTNCFMITLWLVFSSVFTLGLMFFKLGLEGLGLRTILFIGTTRLMIWTLREPCRPTSFIRLTGRWRCKQREWWPWNGTTSKYSYN